MIRAGLYSKLYTTFYRSLLYLLRSEYFSFINVASDNSGSTLNSKNYKALYSKL